MTELRSITVRLNADVDAYGRRMRQAGRDTELAFQRAHAEAGRLNGDLQTVNQSTRELATSTRDLNAATGRLATRTTRLDTATTQLNTSLGQQNTLLQNRNQLLTQNGPITLRTTQQATRGAQQVGNEFDRASGRVRQLLDAILLLGPGAISMSAVAVPAVTALSAQLGVAVGAAGASLVAFIGLGDAVEALNEYALAPSTENLAKVGEELQGLSPDAQDFALRISSMREEINRLRSASAAGFFPHLNESLANADGALERLEDVLYAFSSAAGAQAALGVDALSGDRWEDLTRFLVQEARPTLALTAQTVGALTHGLGEMWMAFDPLNDDAGESLLRSAQAFDRWAGGLSQTEGFADFVAYIRDNGPQVGETLGAWGNALVQIIDAAAPLGGPVLVVLETVADVVSTIADSDIGTPLLAGLAAMTLLNRAAQLFSRTTLGGGTAGAGPFAALRGQATRASTAVRTLRADMQLLSGASLAQRNAAAPTSALGLAAARSAQTMQRLRQAVVPTAAGVGALAVMSTGAGQSIGLQNTAMLGLAGTMLGPWGAAAGATVGLLLDVKAAVDDVTAANRTLEQSLESAWSSGDVDGVIAAADAGMAGLEERLERIHQFGGVNPTGISLGLQQAWAGLTGGTSAWEEYRTSVEDAYTTTNEMRWALQHLGEIMNMPTEDTADLTAVWERAAPAAAALGMSLEDFAAAYDSTDDRTAFYDMARNLANVDARTRSATNAIGEFSRSIESLNAQLEGRASLRDYEAALDAVTASIEENGRSLDISTEAGRANEEALDSIAATAIKASESMAGLERTEFLTRARGDLVAMAETFGMTAADAEAYAEGIGLSMDFIEQSTNAASAETRLLAQQFLALPREVVTHLLSEGFPQSQDQIAALRSQYGELDDADIVTILRARDEATEVLRRVRDSIGQIDTVIKVRVQAISSGFSNLLGTGSAGRSTGGRGRTAQAAGGLYPTVGPQRTVRAYAGGGFNGGDLPNAHRPELYRGTVTRVWGEPETRGEAYVPLANDWRREPAKAVLREVAGMFGGEFVEYGGGGIRRERTYAAATPSGQAVVVTGGDDMAGQVAAAVRSALRALPANTADAVYSAAYDAAIDAQAGRAKRVSALRGMGGPY